MDIICKKQETADVIITIPLVINTGLPDTAATLTIKAINPDGSENTAFTQPTTTEIIAGGGVYRLVFSTSAATRLFTQEDTANPYTLLIKTATSGSTGYRAVRVYVSTKMPSEYATTANVTSAYNLVDALPTLTEIESSSILAKAASVATAAAVDALPTLAEIEASSVLAKESTVSARPTLSAIEGSTVLAKEASVAKIPELSEIEASTVLAKESTVSGIAGDVDTLLSFIKNKKVIRKESSTWYLCVRNSSDTGDILKKALKDAIGADITDLAAGIISQELATSV